MTDTFTIRILPHDRKIEANAGRSLMEALVDHSIFLRSDCGGKGSCGKCKVYTVCKNGDKESVTSCNFMISHNINIEIPSSSLLSSHVISKAPVSFPESFNNREFNKTQTPRYGIATDLGTTTIAMYLCDMNQYKVLSSIAIKNPQALYGDDVMSRIGAINMKKDNLHSLQKLVVNAMEWGFNELTRAQKDTSVKISQIVTVGNPAMIHILAGVDPKPIGISPYQPAFTEARTLNSRDLGFSFDNIPLQILPQISGFIGGDILSAGLAVDFAQQPEGTLLIDLGTNGELLLKGKDSFYATSCATGPAFEGASLSCGTQAIPGAVNKISISDKKVYPEFTIINHKNSKKIQPFGVCGTGVISAVAELYRKRIIAPSGSFVPDETTTPLQKDENGKRQYVLVRKELTANNSTVHISQKDIRSVQLGKSALVTGIEFLLKAAGYEKAEKILIAGAFGTHIEKEDLFTIGMIPEIDPELVEFVGNSAGAGAIMVLCDNDYLKKAIEISEQITTIDLATNIDFQEMFVQRLSFPLNQKLDIRQSIAGEHMFSKTPAKQNC